MRIAVRPSLSKPIHRAANARGAGWHTRPEAERMKNMPVQLQQQQALVVDEAQVQLGSRRPVAARAFVRVPGVHELPHTPVEVIIRENQLLVVRGQIVWIIIRQLVRTADRTRLMPKRLHVFEQGGASTQEMIAAQMRKPSQRTRIAALKGRRSLAGSVSPRASAHITNTAPQGRQKGLTAIDFCRPAGARLFASTSPGAGAPGY